MFDKHFIVKVQIKGVLRFSKNFYFILQYSRLLFMGKGSERRKSLCQKSKKEHRKSLNVQKEHKKSEHRKSPLK